MIFLLRVAFWLSIVIMLLPSGQQAATPGPQVGPAEAVSAASAAVSDMRQFCGRQPEACSIGSHAATVFGHKAQAGAKMLYEFLSDKLAPAETGSITQPRSKRTDVAEKSQHTLTPADMAPPWRGAEQRQGARTKQPT
jgi:hypothetical protein